MLIMIDETARHLRAAVATPTATGKSNLAGQTVAFLMSLADYLAEFAIAYPFHPELIRILNLRVAMIPNFQRTRGALRLLAAAVCQLWQVRPPQAWLIHPHHIDLAQQSIIEDLTSRLAAE